MISSEAQGCDIGGCQGGILDIGGYWGGTDRISGQELLLSVVSTSGIHQCGIHQCGIHATNIRGPEAEGEGSFQPFKVWGLPYLPHVDISHRPC